jgi:nucleoside-diphosphate-sugar epimerase
MTGLNKKKMVITGAAGLVGQNLILRLRQRGYTDIVAIDKHAANMAVLEQRHPEIQAIRADLAESSTLAKWQDAFAGAQALMIGHAQIGGLFHDEFMRNNVQATERVLEAARRHGVPYLVHISSSVVKSAAVDDYTESKKAQEALVVASGIRQAILRPSLMFGWFDRKHLGWLARFMQRAPIFPIPGSGRYLRQPLFVGDFCEVIATAIEQERVGTYNITGQERIDYIDLMRAVKRASGGKAHILRVPYTAFWAMLQVAALFDRNPAFTVRQLEALVTPDVFEVSDWPGAFGVRATPLEQALQITFRDPVHAKVALAF